MLLGCSAYTSAIDIWSAGCVMAELVTASPLFRGDSEASGHLNVFIFHIAQHGFSLRTFFFASPHTHYQPSIISSVLFFYADLPVV